MKGRERGSELGVSVLLVTAEVTRDWLGSTKKKAKHKLLEIPRNRITQAQVQFCKPKVFYWAITWTTAHCHQWKAFRGFGFNSQPQQPQEAICACYFSHQAHVPFYIPWSSSPGAVSFPCVPPFLSHSTSARLSLHQPCGSFLLWDAHTPQSHLTNTPHTAQQISYNK